MPKLQITLGSETWQSTVPEPSPASLPKPHWLKNDYNDPVWEVIDDSPSSPTTARRIRFNIVIFDPRRPDEICRLTDPEYAHLLDTAKRQIYGLRTGRHATVTAAKGHQEMARLVLDWIAWMILNKIRRFSHLDQDDFDAYVEASVYGPGHLLMLAPRFVEYVKGLRKAGIKLPSLKGLTSKPRLDIKKLLEDAGIDHRKGYADKKVSFELLKIAAEEGCHLSPKQATRLLKDPPRPEMLVNISLLRLLQPWSYQWRMSRELPGDCIQFDPFPDTTPDKMALEIGRSRGRTQTAPVHQTMELIDFSIRWVLDYAPVLLDLRDQYDAIAVEGFTKKTINRHLMKVIAGTSIPEGPGRPFPLYASTKKTESAALGFGKALCSFIPAACAVVIAAFSGRRYLEVLSIRAAGPNNSDCITQNDYGLWLETYIAKTVRGWDRTPCNEAVAAAVEVLRRWSAPARANSDDTSLFQYKSLRTNKPVRFNLIFALAEFVNFLDLTPMPDGSRWKFKPHQFRRFFAIMYFWHYEYRDLAALSWHLRHFNPAMTHMYVTESESGAIFRHVNKEHTATILTEAAVGERNISGPYGERFKSTVRKFREHYRRTLKVISPKLVSKVVERYVEKSGRRLKAMLWGWCSCGTLPNQLNTARCLLNRSVKTTAGPDFSQSSPLTCAGCPHHVTERAFEPFWQSDIEFHRRAADDPQNGPIIREASHERAETLSHQYERSFKNSKPLEKLNE